MDFIKEVILEWENWTLPAQKKKDKYPYHKNPELVQLQTRWLADAGSESIITITPREEFISRHRLKWPDDLDGIKIKLDTRQEREEMT